LKLSDTSGMGGGTRCPAWPVSGVSDDHPTLDKAVGLAVRQADSEGHARQVVNEVVEDQIKERRKLNEQN